MENTINAIKHFFEDGKWKYEYKKIDDNSVVFSTGVNMNSILGNLRIYVLVHKSEYTVYAVLNNYAEKNCYPQVAEYLHRANYGMKNGNFEFDFEDGEVRYKAYVNYHGVQLSDSVVEDSIMVPVFMFDKYGKNLMRIMLGEANPQNLIEEAENDPKVH